VSQNWKALFWYYFRSKIWPLHRLLQPLFVYITWLWHKYVCVTLSSDLLTFTFDLFLNCVWRVTCPTLQPMYQCWASHGCPFLSYELLNLATDGHCVCAVSRDPSNLSIHFVSYIQGSATNSKPCYKRIIASSSFLKAKMFTAHIIWPLHTGGRGSHKATRINSKHSRHEE